jgi:hypothetical protein
VLARGQVHAVLSGPAEGTPPASVGNSDRPGHVQAVDLYAPAAVAELAADAGLDPIDIRAAHIDGVGEPFAALEIIDDVAQRVPRRCDDVNVRVGSVLPALISRRQVVIGDALAAVIEGFSLYPPWDENRLPRNGVSSGVTGCGEAMFETITVAAEEALLPAASRASAVSV